MQKAENCCYENYVAQRYLDDPYLVGGKKFDMRIYAVCTNYAPLRVYLYREGFARFTNARYSMSKGDIDNPYVHLTNHAIQKKDESYDAAYDRSEVVHRRAETIHDHQTRRRRRGRVLRRDSEYYPQLAVASVERDHQR